MIPHRTTSHGILIASKDDFELLAEEPAVIIANGEVSGHPFLIVERNGERAILSDTSVVDGIEYLRQQDKPDKPKPTATHTVLVKYCSSLCWDDAFAESITGGIDGAAKAGPAGAIVGGGIGWWVAGPPGAAAGSAIGGAVGVVGGGVGGATAGAIKGYNACEEKKADKCKDVRPEPTDPRL